LDRAEAERGIKEYRVGSDADTATQITVIENRSASDTDGTEDVVQPCKWLSMERHFHLSSPKTQAKLTDNPRSEPNYKYYQNRYVQNLPFISFCQFSEVVTDTQCVKKRSLTSFLMLELRFFNQILQTRKSL